MAADPTIGTGDATELVGERQGSTTRGALLRCLTARRVQRLAGEHLTSLGAGSCWALPDRRESAGVLGHRDQEKNAFLEVSMGPRGCIRLTT